MIPDQLEQTGDQRQKLVTALQTYFDEAGIENDSQLAAVGPADWPAVTRTESDAHRALTIPVMSCLKRLALYTGVVMEKGLYVRKSSTFRELQSFANDQQRSDEVTRRSSTTTMSAVPSKIPDFDMPSLTDNIEGRKYLKSIEQSFALNAMGRFLKDSDYCEQNLEWSSALAERIRKALDESIVLSFLAACKLTLQRET